MLTRDIPTRNSTPILVPRRAPSAAGSVARMSSTSALSTASSHMSATTQNLLKDMLSRSGLSKRKQNQVLHHVQSSPTAALPVTLLASTSNPQSRKTEAQIKPLRVAYRMEPGSFRPGRRLQPDIVKACDNYEVERFRPSATRNRSKEIERLQRVFSQDDAPSSPDDIKVKKLKPRATTDDEPLDPMKELLQEIEERHEFLKAMERLGKADEYRLQVQTEINLRVRQMEVMAKKLDEQDKAAVKLPKLS